MGLPRLLGDQGWEGEGQHPDMGLPRPLWDQGWEGEGQHPDMGLPRLLGDQGWEGEGQHPDGGCLASSGIKAGRRRVSTQTGIKAGPGPSVNVGDSVRVTRYATLYIV